MMIRTEILGRPQIQVSNTNIFPNKKKKNSIFAGLLIGELFSHKYVKGVNTKTIITI